MDASGGLPQHVPGAGQLLPASHLHHPHQYSRGSDDLRELWDHQYVCDPINARSTFGLYVALELIAAQICRHRYHELSGNNLSYLTIDSCGI